MNSIFAQEEISGGRDGPSLSAAADKDGALKRSVPVVVVVVIVVMVVVIVPAFVVSIVVMIPVVVMVQTAVIAIPIAGEIAFAVMVRDDPARAGVGRARPVAVVPAIVPSVGIPVAFDPDEILPWAAGNHGDHAGRRGRADLDADGYLRARGRRGGDYQGSQQQCASQSSDD
jgi:hypothetical protein